MDFAFVLVFVFVFAFAPFAFAPLAFLALATDFLRAFLAITTLQNVGRIAAGSIGGGFTTRQRRCPATSTGAPVRRNYSAIAPALRVSPARSSLEVSLRLPSAMNVFNESLGRLIRMRNGLKSTLRGCLSLLSVPRAIRFAIAPWIVCHPSTTDGGRGLRRGQLRGHFRRGPERVDLHFSWASILV